MSNQVTVELLPGQVEALQSEARNILVTGGLGAGKTAIGVHFVIQMINEYPGVRGLICANTYRQLNDATLTALEDELKTLGFRPNIDYTRKEGVFTIKGTEILTYSLENYTVLDGTQFGWAWVDEAAKAKEEAYRTVKERVRLKGTPCRILLTTTTNGFNWLYDRFVTKANDDHVTIKLRTKDNYFLPESYYSDLVEQFGGEETPIARQQLFGEFVNLTAGQVYTYFSETKNVEKLTKTAPKLYIGMDFNKGAMSAVVCEAYENEVRVLDEIFLEGNAGTYEMAQELKVRYSTANVEIIPDASGKNRTTKSNDTDYSILREEGFTLKTLNKNPPIDDRQQELNMSFLKGRVVIDPKCKRLIGQLHKLTHEDKEGQAGKFDHSVALGYVVYKLNIADIRPKRQPTRPIRF